MKFEDAREVLLAMDMRLDQNVDGKEEAGAMHQVDGFTYVDWQPGHDVVLDGRFTAVQLEAIASWMRVNSK